MKTYDMMWSWKDKRAFDICTYSFYDDTYVKKFFSGYDNNEYLVRLLFMACRNGRVNAVREILNIKERFIPFTKRQKLNEVYENTNSTPFYEACSHGHYEIVKMLLEDKDDRLHDYNRYCTSHEATAFAFSIRFGLVELLKILSNYPKLIDMNKVSHPFLDISPLYIACFHNKEKVVRYLLESGVYDRENMKSKEKSPLGSDYDYLVSSVYMSCGNNLVEVVKVLLEHTDKFDFNMKSMGRSITPLQYACLHGATDVVKELLDKKYKDIIDYC